MKIIVCVKQVPASNETRLDPVTNTIIREGALSVLNPFDAFAVEEAVLLRTRFGGEIHALSMGIPAAADMLRRVIAVGADDARLLSDRAFAGADTLATAITLARAVARIGLPDLILCGRMATDGDTAQVGPMLAEYLGIAHVTDVSAIESVENGAAIVKKLTDDGYQRLKVKLPALMTVLKEINVPRLPSLGGVLRGEKADIPVWGLSDLGMSAEEAGLRGSATRVIKSCRPEVETACEHLTGDAAEQADALIDRLLGAKLIGREA